MVYFEFNTKTSEISDKISVFTIESPSKLGEGVIAVFNAIIEIYDVFYLTNPRLWSCIQIEKDDDRNSIISWSYLLNPIWLFLEITKNLMTNWKEIKNDFLVNYGLYFEN